jgi:hypothetical protein
MKVEGGYLVKKRLLSLITGKAKGEAAGHVEGLYQARTG